MNNQSVYERITGNIIQKLQTGVIPWKASWKKAGMPKNAVTKKVYRVLPYEHSHQVYTIPKRLRPYFKFNRKLLSKLYTAAKLA